MPDQLSPARILARRIKIDRRARIAQYQNNDVSDNGKLPDDISAADNDSIIEKELRKAARSEKDPRTKALLWNQYRQYKGLPVKPAAKVSVSE